MNILSMPKGIVEIFLNGKWENVMMTDSPNTNDVKQIADMYNATEARYIKGNEVIRTYSFK